VHNNKKRKQRKAIRERLKLMAASSREEASRKLHEQLIKTKYWHDADIILTYLACEGEVMTYTLIMQALKEGKTVGVPRIQGDDLVFHAITDHNREKFVYNQYCIPEPCVEHHAILTDLATRYQNILLITPGLAFDRRKGRLGKGKGFYDRTIRWLRSLLGQRLVVMGVCFEEQLVDQVVQDPWDEPVDVVLTEKKCI
jgi:5-formyltetrahydrofolate cyclo-ligase